MKRELLNEEVDQIINQAFWTKGGVSVDKNVNAISESTEEAQGEKVHSCPLCESHLSEEISDEKLVEHLESMIAILAEMNDISDEDLLALDEAIEEELMESEDEDSEDDSDDESNEQDGESDEDNG